MTFTRYKLSCAGICALFVSGALSQCQPNCTIDWTGLQYRWRHKEATETITAETVVEIINTDLGTTRTTTILNEEVERPTNTNSDGTVTTAVTYTWKGEESITEIAFPTSFYLFPSEWKWSGTVPTTDADGSSTCLTETAGLVSFDYWEQPATITMDPVESDTRGWGYMPVYEPFGLEPSSSPSDEAAWSSCNPIWNAPVPPAYGAAYVVQTSRSFESGFSTPMSNSERSPSKGPTSNGPTTEEVVPTTMVMVSEGTSGPTTVTVVTEARVAPQTATETGESASATSNLAAPLNVVEARLLATGMAAIMLGMHFIA